MSKATYRSLQRQDKRTQQNKLERAIEVYGKKNGRILHAVHEIGRSKPHDFSKRLEMAYDIINLSK